MMNLLIALRDIERASGNKKAILFNDLILMNTEYRKIIDIVFDQRKQPRIGAQYYYNPNRRDHASILPKNISLYEFMEGMVNRSLVFAYSDAILADTFITNTIERYKNSRIYGYDSTVITNIITAYLPMLLTHRLNVGIGNTTYRRLTGQKDFCVQLAYNFKTEKNLEDKIKFPVYVQPKLDGYRCVAICDRVGCVKLYSRNGIEFKNFPKIIKDLEGFMHPGEVFDGEIVSETFNAIQRKAFNLTDEVIDDDNVRYHVFDILSLEDWEDQQSTTNYSVRDTVLLNRFSNKKNNQDGVVLRVPSRIANNFDEISLFHEKNVAMGYEGSIVRLDKPYEWKRSHSILKIKDMDTSECTIVRINPHNEIDNAMGSLTVLQSNDCFCNIGSGFTAEERLTYWKNQQELIGKTVEIEHQGYNDTGVMRIATFARARFDK